MSIVCRKTKTKHGKKICNAEGTEILGSWGKPHLSSFKQILEGNKEASDMAL